MAQVHHGVVAFFNNHKGWGFIFQTNAAGEKIGGPDKFVHHASILMDGYRTLAEGDRVTYEDGIREGDGRPMAVNVRRLEASHAG